MGNVSTSQGMIRLSANHEKPRDSPGTDLFSLPPSEGAWSRRHHGFGLLASRTIRETPSVTLSHSGCGHLLLHLQEVNTISFW